jgi:hypothetical protein
MPPRILLLAALVAGCGGAALVPPAPTPERPADACVLKSAGAGDSVGRPGSLVAAAAAADTSLLSPARAWTPIGLDCTGLPVPRVAESWSPTFGGRNWTLVVPSAADLVSAWRARPEAAAALRLGGVTSYVPVDEHRLVVTFAETGDPAFFADPALASGAATADSASFRILPPPADLRDAVDGGADVVITGDPAVADYAARRGGYSALPLPWSRTYVLLVPGGIEALGFEDGAGFRDALARDAVRTWARGAEGARWWDSVDCRRAPSAAASPSPAVVYPSSDAAARALAERIVATARSGAVTRPVADGQLGLAIARGLGTAYVASVPFLPLVPCREVAGWPNGARVVPLIDTRRTAVVRDGTPPLRVDHDGGILLPETP